jgi:hypothetical protein
LPRPLHACAAGALAIALFLGLTPPAGAQTVDGVTLKGSLAPDDDSGSSTGTASAPLNQTAAAVPLGQTDGDSDTGDSGGEASADDGSAPNTASSVSENGATVTQDDSLAGTAPPPNNAAAQGQDGGPSVSLNNTLGDTGEAPPPPLGGLGDQPTQSEADRIVAEEAQGATHFQEEAPLPPLVPEAGAPPSPLQPYAPLGTRIGSFRLYSELTSDVTTTNNALATPNDPHSDWGPELKPDFRLDSDWDRHFLSFDFNADRIWYQNYPVQDAKNYQALMKGRVDVTHRTHATFELESSQTQEGRNGETLPDVNVANSNLAERHAAVGFNHRFNRVTMAVTGTIADYDYSNVLLGDGSSNNFADQDYLERDLKLRSSYEFQPDLVGFIETGLNDRDYRQAETADGYEKGSSGYTLQSGFDFHLGGKLSGTTEIGYGAQNPIDGRLEPVDGFLLNADVLWQMTALTSLDFQARTDLDETTLTDASCALDRFYGLTLTHNLRDNVILGGFITFETAEYIGENASDARLREGLTAEYMLNRNLALVGNYTHTDFNGTTDSSNYNADQVTVGLRLRK